MKQVNEMTAVELDKLEYEFKLCNGLLHAYNMEDSKYVQGNILSYVSPKEVPMFDMRMTAILAHALGMKGMTKKQVEDMAFRAYERHAKHFVDKEAMDTFLCLKLDAAHKEAMSTVKELINIALDTKDHAWFKQLSSLLTGKGLTEERMVQDVQAQLQKYGIECTKESIQWAASGIKPAYSFSVQEGFVVDVNELNRRLFGNPYGPEGQELPY